MGKIIYKEFSFWVVGHIDGAEPQIGEGLKTCFSTGNLCGGTDSLFIKGR